MQSEKETEIKRDPTLIVSRESVAQGQGLDPVRYCRSEGDQGQRKEEGEEKKRRNFKALVKTRCVHY